MDEVAAARESVPSPASTPHISHAVIATYVADAVRSVPGAHGSAGGGFGPLGRRGDRAARGARVSRFRDDDGRVDLDLRLLPEHDAAAPDICRAVEAAVRDDLGSTVAVETGQVRVVIEGCDPT